LDTLYGGAEIMAKAVAEVTDAELGYDAFMVRHRLSD